MRKDANKNLKTSKSENKPESYDILEPLFNVPAYSTTTRWGGGREAQRKEQGREQTRHISACDNK